jgi:hypothetical protein
MLSWNTQFSMKRRIILFVIPILFALGIFFTIAFFLSQNGGKGALQVTANPNSNVYLNGKLIGKTPLCKCEGNDMLPVGDYNIKVDPGNVDLASFEEKITVSKGILTVVDRTFGKGVTSDGSIISLTPLDDPKAVQLLVISFPDVSQVSVDSSPAGTTPLLVKDITESDHEITIKKDGYRDKTIRIKTIAGYKLTVEAFLGVSVGAPVSPTPTIAAPTASPSATPIPAQVVILHTPVGFLRVREASNAASAEVARVSQGETYTLLQEADDWFEIALPSGKEGWISKQYAKKQ